MSRLKSKIKHMAASQIDNAFSNKIIEAYTESMINEFKNSKYIEQIPQEKREEFYKFIKDRCEYYRDVEEYDFLINPIMDIINKAAKEAVSNAGDIDVENFLNQ